MGFSSSLSRRGRLADGSSGSTASGRSRPSSLSTSGNSFEEASPVGSLSSSSSSLHCVMQVAHCTMHPAALVVVDDLCGLDVMCRVRDRNNEGIDGILLRLSRIAGLDLLDVQEPLVLLALETQPRCEKRQAGIGFNECIFCEHENTQFRGRQPMTAICGKHHAQQPLERSLGQQHRLVAGEIRLLATAEKTSISYSKALESDCCAFAQYFVIYESHTTLI